MWKAITSTEKYLASLPANLRRTLVRTVQKITKSGSPVAYSALFPVSSGFSFPATFSPNEFPGLLFCHIIRGSSGDKVVACWSDEDHFRAYVKKFGTETGMNTAGVSATPEVEGAAIEVQYARVPFWKFWKKLEEYSVKELAVGALVLLGVFLTIRDNSALFFAAPDVIIPTPMRGEWISSKGRNSRFRSP